MEDKMVTRSSSRYQNAFIQWMIELVALFCLEILIVYGTWAVLLWILFLAPAYGNKILGFTIPAIWDVSVRSHVAIILWLLAPPFLAVSIRLESRMSPIPRARAAQEEHDEKIESAAGAANDNTPGSPEDIPADHMKVQ